MRGWQRSDSEDRKNPRGIPGKQDEGRRVEGGSACPQLHPEVPGRSQQLPHEGFEPSQGNHQRGQHVIGAATGGGFSLELPQAVKDRGPPFSREDWRAFIC